MDKKESIQICSVVCQAILIDGQLTDTEREYLNNLMDSMNLAPEDRKEVTRRNIDDDVFEMARLITSTEGKERVLKEVSKVISVDGVLSKVEHRLMKKVATGVGYSEEQLKTLLGA